MKKYYILVLLSIVLTLTSCFYVTKCSIGGFFDLCFDGYGFPLPYFNSNGIWWTTLLIDFVFWLVLISLIYTVIFYIIKFVKFLIKN